MDYSGEKDWQRSLERGNSDGIHNGIAQNSREQAALDGRGSCFSSELQGKPAAAITQG